MKILIVSGFLGAGKTTFIKTLAAVTGQEFAILENEYGEVSIDSEVLSEGYKVGNVNIWELTEGCICCSTKGDFAASVLTIANTVDPKYLVVEPTGVGMLGNILINLKQIEYERISLLSPVTIVDGRSFGKYLSEYPSIYRDQIIHAGTVFVSKMENAEEEELKCLEAAISELDPGGRIVTSHYSRLSHDELSRILRINFDGTVEEAHEESGGDTDILPDTFSVSGISMKSPEMLFILLEGLISGRYGNIMRAKGLIKAGEQWLRFDLADGRYLVTGAEEIISAESYASVYHDRVSAAREEGRAEPVYPDGGFAARGEGRAAPPAMRPRSSPSKAVFIGQDIKRRDIRRFFMR